MTNPQATRQWSRAIPALVMLAVLLTPLNIFSCGPFFIEAIFVPANRPVSLKDYLAGRLGVVQPTYYRVYLAVAYRVLSGKPFDAAQLAQVQHYWDYGMIVDNDLAAAQKQWAEARAGALAQKPPLGEQQDPYARTGFYSQFLNCTPDGFRNAALTARNRTQRFGAASATLQGWVTAQDAVFRNCGDQRAVPQDAASDAPQLIREDRAYQIAAALFYGEEYPKATAAFDRIAADSASPWSTLAPYLAARSLIRQGTVAVQDRKTSFDPQLLTEAETRLKAVLANKSLVAIHPAAERTLGFVEFRLHPEQRAHELALRISGEEASDNLGQDLIDYTRLLDKLVVAGNSTYQPFGNQPGFEAMTNIPQPDEPLIHADDLTDWIITAQLGNPAAHLHAMEQWNKRHSLPWLVAALVTAGNSDSGVAELLQAAAIVSPDSPGYDSATYQRARLLLESGHADQVRALLEPQLRRFPANLPSATRNLYVGLLFRASDNFQDFLKYMPQRPVELGVGDDTCVGTDCAGMIPGESDPFAPRFDVDVAATLNVRLPLKLMVTSALSEQMPENLRSALVVATWTRAALLNDAASAAILSRALAQQLPQSAGYLADYAAATDQPTREFAAAFAMLHFPGMRPSVVGGVDRDTPLDKIDNYRRNWWGQYAGPNFDGGWRYCGSAWDDGEQDNAADPAKLPSPSPGPNWPLFLSTDDRKLTDAQRGWLLSVGTAPNYFGRVVLAWAKAHPDDPRVPEALHLVVRSTRYGCGNKETGGFSRRAFDLLHRQYPKSEWTTKTPLWFQ